MNFFFYGVACAMCTAAWLAPPSDNGAQAAVRAAMGAAPEGAGIDPSTEGDPGFADSDPSSSSDTTLRGADNGSVGGVAPVKAGYSGGVPEFHVVELGDTLWKIADLYMKDPYGWPRLWAYNEQITNPHWIFPGDRVRLREMAGGQRLEGERLRLTRTQLPKEVQQDAYLLRQIAFVAAADFETSMRVTGGGDANVMLSTDNTVYMSYSKRDVPAPGELVAVYSPLEEVRDAKGRKRLGYIVQIMGEVEVQSLSRKAVEGLVVRANNPIERGYRVGPLRRAYRRIEARASQRSATGNIVATLNTAPPMPFHETKARRRKFRGIHTLVGEEDFVVVDMGTREGVEEGNLLEVIRRGDGYTKKRVLDIPYEEGWPRRVVGAILVVETRDDVALGVVLYARQELSVGDHVELRGTGAEGLATDETSTHQTPATDARVDADAHVRIGG